MSSAQQPRMVSEYGSNYTHRPAPSAGYLPPWYASRIAQGQNLTQANRLSKQSNQQTDVMNDWLVRTNSQNFGAFSNSYPHHSPFSSDDHLKLPAIKTDEQVYRERYEELLHQLARKKKHMKDLPGGGKGVWRHIKESYGAGPSLLSWVDTFDLFVYLLACGSVRSHTQPVPSRVIERSGKGPFKHIIDSYGAGSSVISWVNGLPPLEKNDRSARFSTCVPLPTPYQEDFGPYTLIGGRRIRDEVKALRD